MNDNDNLDEVGRAYRDNEIRIGGHGEGTYITVKSIEGAPGIKAQPTDLNRMTMAQWVKHGENVWANFPLYVDTMRRYLEGRYSLGPGAIDDSMMNELVNWRGALLVASTMPPDSYAGLDIRGVSMAAYDLAELMPGIKYLTQADLNFLTLQDVKGAKHRGLYLQGTGGPDITQEVGLLETAAESDVFEALTVATATADVRGDPREISLAALVKRYREGAEAQALMRAFQAQLIAEAEPHKARVITGAYVLDRVPFPQLDAYISYDNLRLVIGPRGIFFSIVKTDEAGESYYVTSYWAPDSPPVLLDPVLYPMISVVLAGVWRDACVIREKWYTERARNLYHYSKTQLRRKVAPLILPRQVSRVSWASDVERVSIAHTMHTVRGHYRRLAEGWKQGDKAADMARHYGYPEPPAGYTFVIPHTRGEGAAEAEGPARRVICRGLMSVKVSLS